MKHIIRKPILPILLAAVLIFGVCFMTLFQKGIEDDKQQVENLYQNTTLVFQILPGENATTALRLDTYTGSKILALDALQESYVRMECLYSLRVPQLDPGCAVVYGTNNLRWLTEDMEIQLSFAEGWNFDRFLREEDSLIPCVMDAEQMERLDLSFGDTVVISGSPEADSDPEKAPDLGLTLVGSYKDEKEKLAENTLIVPEGLFLAKPGLLYNSNMMFDCFYRVFTFTLDPSYNRQYKQIQDQVEEILDDPGKFTVYSNARILEQAIRPIERRLQIQQMLVLPLAILFCVAAAVLTVLLTISFRTEIFLRFMWGERRLWVFLQMLFSVISIHVLCAFLLLPLILLMAGNQWLMWSYHYFWICAAVTAAAACVPLTQTCCTNLVSLYQSREG